jgi:CheY-like chemotaxis protein
VNSLSKAKILVVDDSDTNRMLLQFTLEELGFEVLEAPDGNRAVELALEQNCAAVFMDINMPKMGGIEALQILNSLNYDSPIIACSAEENSEAIENYLQSGFSSFVPKPIEPELVAKTLQELGINATVKSHEFEQKHQDKIAELKERFIINLPVTIDGLTIAFKTANIERLRRFCHILKANAGQFGFEEISIISRDIEAEILAARNDQALTKAKELIFKLHKINEQHSSS